MASELFLVSPAGSVVFYPVHRDGSRFRNSGLETVRIYNGRDHIVKCWAVATERCSDGFLHNFPEPVKQINPGNYYDLPLLKVLRFNDSVGEATIQFTDQADALLPDDDSSGHPDDVTIAAIPVMDAGGS
jgi:hypothetical protein